MAAHQVLCVLEDDNLQANAANLGRFLLTALRSLQASCQLIGDVRGSGLFIGVEFVEPGGDRHSNAHAAQAVVTHLRLHGSVLCGTDGLDGNVVKIKPPMSWRMSEARWFIDAFSDAVTSLAHQ